MTASRGIYTKTSSGLVAAANTGPTFLSDDASISAILNNPSSGANLILQSLIAAGIPPALASNSSVVAAATSAVTTALTNAGVLYATNAPTLDTTRFVDPQGKDATSGSFNNGTSIYDLVQLTTGLPTGVSYGWQSTRKGALSSVIAQIRFGGSGAAGQPFPTLVTPGETISVSAALRTDQATSRGRIDLQFWDATGVLVSTVSGTYVNFADVNVWERRNNANALVPANAHHVTVQGTVSTLGPNTVVGAKAAMTAVALVSGNVTAPAYIDGANVGWAWNGTAFTSSAKKVLFGPADVASPASVTSAVASHVADSDPHPGYLRKTKIPVLATNRSRDPQFKAAAISTAPASYPLTRITTGLPTGFAFGLETVRTATVPNSVLSQLFLAPAAVTAPTDPLRIPVTPGETISASVQMWTDTANIRARLDIIYYDAAGALVGAVVAGTYTNIAVSTWEPRAATGLVVPANAAFVTPQATVSTVSGGGNAPTGGKFRVTGLTVATATGNTAPVYGDGTSDGWDWSGTAHASTSVKLFSTTSATADATTRPLTLVKAGNVLTLSRPFGGASTLTQTLDLGGSANGGFTFTLTTIDGTTVHEPSDDICPIRTQLGTVGANHGYSCVATFNNPDAKTNADLGSRWTDGTREYVLLGFSGALLVLGGSYVTDGNGVTTSADVSPSTNLTHVSGATHTGAIDFTTKISAQLRPSLSRIGTTVWADGRAVTADGIYQSSEMLVRESYAILDYAALYDAAKANVGVSYTTLDIAGCVRVSNAYRWTAAGCRITTDLTELKPTDLGQCGAVQAVWLSDITSTLTRYLPGVGVVSGFDWGAGVNMTGYATDVLVTSSNLTSASRPPCVSLDTLSSSGVVSVGFALGYLPYGERGDEASRSSQRLTRAATKLWDLRGTKKNYPTFTMSETHGWSHLRAESFRSYLTPSQVATVLASKGDASSAWEALNAQANIAA